VHDHDTLSDAERYHVEQLIQNDQTAASLLKFFQDFYLAFSKRAEAVPESVVEFVDSLYPLPRRIELHPYQLPETPTGNSPSFPESSDNGDGHETLATLASPEHHTLARLILDPSGQEANLYVRSDDPRNYANALISLKNPFCEALADSRGHARFSVAFEEGYSRVHETQVVIHPVVDSIDVNLLDADPDTPIEVELQTVCLRCVVSESAVTLRIEPLLEKDTMFGYLAVEWDAHAQILPLLENACVFNPGKIPETMTVRLFG